MWSSRCSSEVLRDIFSLTLSSAFICVGIIVRHALLQEGKEAPDPHQISLVLQQKRMYLFPDISSLSPREGSHWPNWVTCPHVNQLPLVKTRKYCKWPGLRRFNIWLKAWNSKSKWPGFKSHFLCISVICSLNHFLHLYNGDNSPPLCEYCKIRKANSCKVLRTNLVHPTYQIN